MPLVVSGAFLGCLVGGCIFAACRLWPWVLPSLTVLVMTVSGAGIVAPLGWIAGDSGSTRMPRVGMANRLGLHAALSMSQKIRGCSTGTVNRTRPITIW